MQSLNEVFIQAESVEDTRSLNFIFKIFKFLLNFQDSKFVEILLSNKYYLLTFGALEYNPDINRDSDLAKYREFLQNKAVFKQISGF